MTYQYQTYEDLLADQKFVELGGYAVLSEDEKDAVISALCRYILALNAALAVSAEQNRNLAIAALNS